MATPNVNATWAAGLKDASVRLADDNEYDINAVVSAEGDPQQDEIEVKGDDELKATFVSNITEELTIMANALSFDVLQAITGNELRSDANSVSIDLGTDSQENPPFIELTAKSQAKNADGTIREVVKVWHKVQIYSVKLSQAGEQEVNAEMKGRAYQTDEDITGQALDGRCVATITVQTPA